MNRQEVISEVNQKNVNSIEQSIKSMNEQILNQQIQINNLHNTLSTIYDRLAILENFISVQRAKLMGTGPSVKE